MPTLLIKSFKTNIGSFLWGTCLTSLISVVVWAFAYYGYIDLGLPERFEFEKLDHTIRSNIPKNFDYTLEKSKLRNSEYDSIVVTASTVNSIDGNAKEDQSDIILILDRTNKAYELTYKFSARFKDANTYNFPLHVRSLYLNDVNNDKLTDLVIGWSYLGASYSPPAVIVLASNDSPKLLLNGVPHLNNYEYPTGHRDIEVYNSFDKTQRVNTDIFHTVFAKNGEFTVVNRDDDACNACSEEHIYNSNSFRMYDSKIYESGVPKLKIKGFKELEKTLKQDGYNLDS